MSQDDLPTRLMEATRAGEPWPKKLEKELWRTRPGQLLHLFRQLRVRQEVFRPEGQPSLPRLDDLATHSRLRYRHKPSNSPVTLPRLLYLLRAQWDYLISLYTPESQERLTHVWQVQLCPITLRKRMMRYLGLTFLPPPHQAEFPEEWIDLNQLNVLSLGFRPHQARDGQILDMLDIKIHGVDLDVESGQATLVPRTSHYFNFCPFPGADRRIVDASNLTVIRGGLDLHRAMEWAAVTGSGVQDEPNFPRIYLGFQWIDDVDMEPTTDLKVEGFRRLDSYVRAGRPKEWPACPLLVKLRERLDSRPRPSWSHYESQLGDQDARFALLATLGAATVEVDGLQCVPLEFFSVYSDQRPVRRAMRRLARMEAPLLKRMALRGDPVCQDGTFVGVDGRVEAQPQLARVQVLKVPDRESWAGSTGPIEWDFRTVSSWCADYFREPGCSDKAAGVE